MNAATKPQPRLDPLNRPFWDHAAEGRLAVQACEACDDLHFPPSPICPKCNSDRQSWRVVSGRGTLESWVAFHRAYWPGFADELPYDVCLVRLEEGPLLVSNLVGGTEGAKVGAPVGVVFDRSGEGAALPKWALSRS
jgi:uncharacterized protein